MKIFKKCGNMLSQLSFKNARIARFRHIFMSFFIEFDGLEQRYDLVKSLLDHSFNISYLL